MADGSRASKVADARNAAQSATNTMTQMAAPAARRKPVSTGAGAWTSWKRRQAAERSSPAAVRVRPVGTSAAVVSR